MSVQVINKLPVIVMKKNTITRIIIEWSVNYFESVYNYIWIYQNFTENLF